MRTVSGRFPEYSATLKMSRPHLLVSCSSWGPRDGVLREPGPRWGMDPRWAGAHLGQQPLLLRAHPKAWDGSKAGAVSRPPHTADLRHRPLPALPLLLLGQRWRDLHLVLLVCVAAAVRGSTAPPMADVSRHGEHRDAMATGGRRGAAGSSPHPPTHRRAVPWDPPCRDSPAPAANPRTSTEQHPPARPSLHRCS